MFTSEVEIIRHALLQELADEKKRKKKKFKLCDAEKCQNSSYNCDLSFFKFPKQHPERMKKWLANIALKKDTKTEKMLCRDHFEENAFTNTFCTRLQCEAVPTIQDPDDLTNEKPKPFPCLLGLSTYRDLNAVENITRSPPVFQAKKNAVICAGKDGFSHRNDWINPKSTDLEPSSISSSSSSIPQIQSCAGNIKYHHSMTNKATMTSPFLHLSSPEYASLKAQIKAKSSAVSKFKKRIKKMDTNVLTPSQLIKYASHYLTGKTLSLFSSQIQNSTGKAKRSFRCNKDDLELANTIYQLNRNVYRYLISNDILHLPCRQTLKRFPNNKQEVCDRVYSKTAVKPSENHNGTSGIANAAREIANRTSKIEVRSSDVSYINEPHIIRVEPCEIKEEGVEVIQEQWKF